MKTQFFILAFIGKLMISGACLYHFAVNTAASEESTQNSPQDDPFVSHSAPEEAVLTVACTATATGVQITGHLQDSRSYFPIAGIIKRADGSILSTTPQGWFGFTGNQWEWIFFEVDGYQTTGRQIVVSKSAYWIIRMNKY